MKPALLVMALVLPILWACQSSANSLFVARLDVSDTLRVQWDTADTSEQFLQEPLRPAIPPVASFVTDSFGLVRGICTAGRLLAVLDAAMEPHVSVYEGREPDAHRALRHRSTALGEVRPEAIACRPTAAGATLTVLDRRARRLLMLEYRIGRGFDAGVRVIDLTHVLQPSDQPISIASTAAGTALGGVLVSGARFLWTTNDTVWHRAGARVAQQDSATASFLSRIAEGTRVVGDQGSEHLIATGNYVPLMWRLNTLNRVGQVDRYGTGEAATLTLRKGADSGWRLHWDRSTRLRAMAVASSEDVFGILDCDCTTRDSLSDRANVIIGRFSAPTFKRVTLTGHPSTFAIDADKRTLIGVLGKRGAERLFTWDVNAVIGPGSGWGPHP